jgi:signal transduction histidine kinase
VTQDALTNAAKHAPGQPVEVHLSYTSGAVTVCVLNDTPEAIPGAAAGAGQAARRAPDLVSTSQISASHISGRQGLRGMSERMASVGGTFTAGPAGSRWRVEAKSARDRCSAGGSGAGR